MSSREWYNALMDYGAMLKATVGNPNINSASYTKQSTFKGSRRELRGKIVREAMKGNIRAVEFSQFAHGLAVSKVFSELTSEGFLKKRGEVFSLA